MNVLSHQVQVGVVGAGTMGIGIAQVAASAGHTVWVYDNKDGAAIKAIDSMVGTLNKLIEKGKISEETSMGILARLRPAKSLQDLRDCGLIIEAIVEQFEPKIALFRELENYVAPSCILSSNTSSIGITRMAATLQHSRRFVGLHFFNPAPLMPLVEIIRGLQTDPALLDILSRTMTAWKKKPVLAKSTPGFIVNRIARPYYAEALRLLTNEAIAPVDLDAVMTEAGGFKMGPCALMDLIGHDVNAAVTQSVFESMSHDKRYEPSLLQQEMVSGGYLGKKSGQGFYDYRDNRALPVPNNESSSETIASIQIEGHLSAGHGLIERLTQADVIIDHMTAQKNIGGFIRVSGDARLMLCDGRSATQAATEDRFHNTVMFDLCLDFHKAKRICITRASSCSDDAYAKVVALLQQAKFEVTRMGDVPGMPVTRTVCMLINEACDAVFQGVANVNDCDTAMRNGVNYPLGPFAWADQLGTGHIIKVLRNLQKTYGEERYRLSPLLQHRHWSGKKFHE
ncbi:MAG: 3-hydroxyadipyl-CoA dehydrogenase [Pseudomonadota bacterium]|jgi:3-hydroxybutyryl-CoA dehydrogenase